MSSGFVRISRFPRSWPIEAPHPSLVADTSFHVEHSSFKVAGELFDKRTTLSVTRATADRAQLVNLDLFQFEIRRPEDMGIAARPDRITVVFLWICRDQDDMRELLAFAFRRLLKYFASVIWPFP